MRRVPTLLLLQRVFMRSRSDWSVFNVVLREGAVGGYHSLDSRQQFPRKPDCDTQWPAPLAGTNRKCRAAYAMDLLRLERLSEARAATILDLASWDLLELMGRYDVPTVRMSIEKLDRELATEIKRPTRHD